MKRVERKAQLFVDSLLKNTNVQNPCAENVTALLTFLLETYFEVSSPPSPASPSDRDFCNPPSLLFPLFSTIPPPQHPPSP